MKLYYLLGWLLSPFAAAGFYVFSVVTKTSRARVIACNENNEILLVKTWVSRNTWGLPGGGMERGESSQEAACREFYEEVGVSISPGELQLITTVRTRAHQEILFFLRIEKSRLPVVLPNRFEIKEADWFSLSNMPRLIEPWLKDILLTVAARS